MYRILREILFLLPPETAHTFSLQAMKWWNRISAVVKDRSRAGDQGQTFMGLQFPNRIGLAAGLDKNGDYLDCLGNLGCGFVEIGTVTPRPQPGNPKPRLFRLKRAQAIINRMGFNNKGVDYLIGQARKRHYKGILGINIGKNFDTPLEQAVNDYLMGLEKAWPLADYITVNISSPNTPGLRSLQQKEMLAGLLSPLKEKQKKLADDSGRFVPLVVKVAPDLTQDDIVMISETVNQLGIEGVIATNTTLSRRGVEGMKYADEQGGLSGKPLLVSSTEVLRAFRKNLDASVVLIAAGGVTSTEDMQLKINAGADLVQIYTGLIYRGPSLVRQLAKV